MIPFGPFLLRVFVLATVLSGARSLGDFAGLDAVSDSFWTYVTLGLSTILIGRREWSTKIPFGPYLALGALLWLFSGPELVRWYWSFTLPAPG